MDYHEFKDDSKYEQLIILICITGSDLTFETTKNEIVPNLTPNMTMRCSLDNGLPKPNTSTSASGSLVGRRDVSSIQQIAALSSIAITRDGVDIASVSYINPARSLVDTNVHITGAISGMGGYIELTWDYPLLEQLGKYVCELNGLTTSGHNIVLNKSLSVNAEEASLNDLITHIHDLEVRDAQKETKIHDLEVRDMQKETKIQLHESEIQTLKSELAEARHIESGHIECGKQSTWPDAANKRISQSFQNAYKKAPVVHLSQNYLDANMDDPYLIYKVNLVSVSTNGFVMNCFSYPDDNHGDVYGLSVDWIAVPQ